MRQRLALLAAAAMLAGAAPEESCPPNGSIPVPLLPHTRAALATNQPIVIVALGSSSTRGWMAKDVSHSYPAVLQRLLNDEVPKAAISVINRGIGGQDAPEELGRLDQDVLAIRPYLVIWQVGANGALRGAAPDMFKRLILEGIRKIKAAGADIILMDNQRSPRILAASDHAAVEATLRQVAQSAGVNLFSRGALMDRWAETGAPNEDFVAPDGLHMNTRGYDCLAQALGGSISTALRQPIVQQRDKPNG